MMMHVCANVVKCCVFVLVGVFLVSSLSAALQILGYDETKHDRFYVGDDKAFIGESYDWSGIARRPDSHVGWATLISERYFVSASHWHPTAGSTLRFYYTNNPADGFEERIVEKGWQIGRTDLWLGRLVEPVSSRIKHYPILAPEVDLNVLKPEIWIWGLSNLATQDTNMRLGRNVVDQQAGFMYFWSYNVTQGLGPDEAMTVSGDSSGPSFVIVRGQPAILGIHTARQMDTYIPPWVEELERLMDGEQVATIALEENVEFVPAIESQGEGVFSLSWSSFEGADYRLLCSQDLDTWTPVDNIEFIVDSTTGRVTCKYQNSDQGLEYFCVQADYGASDTEPLLTSEIVGYHRVFLDGNQQVSHFLGSPFHGEIEWTGIVSAVLGDQLVVEGAILGDLDETYYIELVSESEWQGVTSTILMTVDKALFLRDNLEGILKVGDSIVIKKHNTLADMFGENNEVGLVSSSAWWAGDYVIFLSPVTGYQYYYYDTVTMSWKNIFGQIVDPHKVVLEFGLGCNLVKWSRTSSEIVFTGQLQQNQTYGVLEPGVNLISPRFPKPTSLNQLFGRDGGELMSGAAIYLSDTVVVLDPVAGYKQFYFNSKLQHWVDMRRGEFVDVGDELVLQPGSGFYVIRRGDAVNYLERAPL